MQSLSITELTHLINTVLEVEFPSVPFIGEISQIQRAQSGHIYFTLKDEKAQISCVMWNGVARTLNFKPDAGILVECLGRPNIYPQSGRFQFVVNKMVESGEGGLRRKFEELKNKLELEGLFSPDRKRQIPFLPKAVGIVTSRTGAVIHDIMVKIRERFPSIVTYLADTRVQGEGSAIEIANAIQELDRSNLVDVIIVARGGGSLEDLWSFNEEIVVRAIFACSTPVIAGIGHEVDITLSDLVADVRAPTPTAAAEMAVPRRDELLMVVENLFERLKDTDHWMRPKEQRVDELTFRLEQKISSVLELARLRIKGARLILKNIKPDQILFSLQERILNQEMRLKRNTIIRIERQRDHFDNLEMRLKNSNHHRILERGYGVIWKDQAILKSKKQVNRSDKIKIMLSDGTFNAEVSE